MMWLTYKTLKLLCGLIPVSQYRRSARKKIQSQYIAPAYAKWIDDLHNNKSNFVSITNKPFTRKQNTPKLFAYYLTQYHAIPENDAAHGKGFTEWTNIAAATPQFVGHYQPKIPYDLGFYNLLDVNVMRRQAELAKMYGIYGWCFYFYWFSGKKVLEKPLYNFLKSDIDMPFHLCWANENWSKLWDGGNKEIILEQKLGNGDAERFFDDILPFIQDKRYEKIDNKPILMIYRPAMFPAEKMKSFLKTLDKLAREKGFDGFWFMASNAFNFDTPVEYGFRGIIEFPPHGMGGVTDRIEALKFSTTANFSVFGLTRFIKEKLYITKPNYTLFKAVFPSWDNTPRKAYSEGICFNLSEQEYKQWLSGVIKWTRENNKKNQQYIYINAWNEWGEGAILEPTTRYGYKNLELTKQCLEEM